MFRKGGKVIGFSITVAWNWAKQPWNPYSKYSTILYEQRAWNSLDFFLAPWTSKQPWNPYSALVIFLARAKSLGLLSLSHKLESPNKESPWPSGSSLSQPGQPAPEPLSSQPSEKTCTQMHENSWPGAATSRGSRVPNLDHRNFSGILGLFLGGAARSFSCRGIPDPRWSFGDLLLSYEFTWGLGERLLGSLLFGLLLRKGFNHFQHHDHVFYTKNK